jgi:hypothetical protein
MFLLISGYRLGKENWRASSSRFVSFSEEKLAHIEKPYREITSKPD